MTVQSTTSRGSLPSTVAPLQRIFRDASPTQVASILDDDGAVIISNFLTQDQVKRINQEVDESLRQLAPAGRPDLPQAIRDSNGVNTKRLTDLITN